MKKSQYLHLQNYKSRQQTSVVFEEVEIIDRRSRKSFPFQEEFPRVPFLINILQERIAQSPDLDMAISSGLQNMRPKTFQNFKTSTDLHKMCWSYFKK